MKLIYQYMMAFLVVVVTCLSVISVAIYRYSEKYGVSTNLGTIGRLF